MDSQEDPERPGLALGDLWCCDDNLAVAFFADLHAEVLWFVYGWVPRRVHTTLKSLKKSHLKKDARPDSSILATSRTYSLSVVVLLLFSLPVHLYFLAMWIAWTWYWIDGSRTPKTEKEFVAYGCAFFCFVISGVAIMGVAVRR